MFKVWILLTVSWLTILSGIFFTQGFGPPGFIQWLSIQRETSLRQMDLNKIEAETATLDTESLRLEKSKSYQEKEIRRVLGYTASDELVFDFSSGDRVGDWSNR